MNRNEFKRKIDRELYIETRKMGENGQLNKIAGGYVSKS